jgi:hypothetical protein
LNTAGKLKSVDAATRPPPPLRQSRAKTRSITEKRMAAAAGGDGGWGSLGQLPTPLHSTRLRSAVLCAVLLLATTPSEEEVAAEEVADA